MRDSKSMTRAVTAVAAAVIAASGVAASAARAQQAQPAPKHHSKIKGALVGGAAGAVVGHPKLGAAAGVMHQHSKNKKAAAGG